MMTHNSHWQVHCEILTGMSQMTSLWQLPKIRNIPAFFFFKCANCSANNNPSGENSLRKFTKWFLVMPYKLQSFFKQMALQFIFWTLLSTQQDVVSAKTRNAQIHSWLSRSVAPSVFPSVSFSPHHCWEAWFPESQHLIFIPMP